MVVFLPSSNPWMGCKSMAEGVFCWGPLKHLGGEKRENMELSLLVNENAIIIIIRPGRKP